MLYGWDRACLAHGGVNGERRDNDGKRDQFVHVKLSPVMSIRTPQKPARILCWWLPRIDFTSKMQKHECDIRPREWSYSV